jgi:uncharacterized membrane protein
MRKLYYIYKTLVWLTAVALAVYHTLIFRGLEMQLWAKIVLISCIAAYFVLLGVGVKLEGKEDSSMAERVLRILSRVPVYAIAVPFALVFCLLFLNVFKNHFGFLKKLGYTVTKNKNERIYTKDDTVIKVVPYTTYLISFDGGQSFKPFEYSSLGTLEERDMLLTAISEYESAHPVDKQRGDTVNLDAVFSEFLKKNLPN